MNERAAKSIGFETGRAAVIETVQVLPAEEVRLGDAVGRVVRQNLVCDTDCPPSGISAMDGYALAAAGTTSASRRRIVWLRLMGTVTAGGSTEVRPGPGECVAVTTGACIPEGADTVVPCEDVAVRNDLIGVARPSPAGAFIRRRGEIARRGDRLNLAGKRATPQVLGLAAAFGARKIAVAMKPRVGVFATGDELVSCEALPDRRHVRASNLAMLVALVRESGCTVLDAGLSRDSREDITRHLEACADCDVVVISGGVGGGLSDLVPDALRRFGADLKFAGIRMRPGKRTVLAVKDNVVFFGLPGNPGAAFVAFHVLVRPGLLAMMGWSGNLGTLCWGRATAAIEKDGREAHTLFVLARSASRGSGDDLAVEPITTRGTGDLVALADAVCLIPIGEDTRSVRPGERVEVIMLPGAPAA